MANPGGVGSKFVSVNLNKSYGQPSNSSTRVRSAATAGSHGVGGGVGGGMVVLSRHRSSIVGVQKGGPKLSVPPPLNLPSLRKEHERFDSSASGGGASGSGTSGTGSRPTSSGMGWSKPALSTLQEKDNSDDHPLFVRSGGGSQVVVDGGNKQQPSQDQRMGNSVYMPPSARSGTVGPPVTTPSRPVQTVEKAVVLKGEDFPSLQATLPTATGGAGQKQHDALHQKHKQKVNEEETFNEQKDNSYSRPSFDMRPQIQSSRLTAGNGSGDNGGDGYGSRGSGAVEQSRKNDAYFPGPLPLVRLKHTSDWADDERDTGHGFSDRDRDNGYSRSESVREKEFDLPMPRTSVPNLSDGRGVRDDEAGKGSVREYTRVNTYNRDVRTPSREGHDGNSWRASPITKDGFSSREMGIDRNGVGARPSSSNREVNRESKYSGDNARDGFNSGVMAQDSRFGRRDTGYGQGGRQNGNLSVESFTGRGVEQRDRYGGDQSSRYRGNFFQNNAPKASYSMGSKGLHVIDPVFNFIKEKRSTSGKPSIEDPFLKDFVSGPSYDGRDPLTGGLVGVFKRKKDILKQADFHDPVRESFEAELERVQKIQEQERQRVVEEQARALEIARKEEEERERLVREEEERRRRVEEEAREAAWRAEQERLEAIRRTEEQRIAREEEKQRMAMEEERRKEAARKKLMELEARIARRQTEVVKDDKFSVADRDERIPGVVKEKDVPRVADVVDWEDGERMVERITSSTSSDSSNLNRSFEMGSRPSFSSGDAAFLDRGKPANSWRRDTFDHGNNTNFLLQDQDSDYRSPRRDTVGAGRSFPRKEQYGGSSVISARTSSKGGFSEPHNVDDFPHMRGHKWNLAGDGDHYGRNSEHDSEFYDNSADRFGDMGWGQGRSRGSPHASYPERLYQNFEADGFSTFGRSRHSMRQPRVLPPPSLASMHKNPLRTEIEHPGSSTYLDGEMSYHHAPRKSEPIGRTGYDGGYQERIGQPRMVDIQQDNTIPQEQKEENAISPRCDSQSSLSVSSPPHSPTHLSHDDLENSGDSPMLPTAAKGEEISLSDDENVVSVAETGKMHTVNSNTVSPVDDEEWATENDEELQEQEEYDEEEDGYLEEDEVQDGDDEHIDLSPEFEDLHLEVKEASEDRGQMVLGFDGGVEVGIPSGDEFEGASRNGEPSVGMQKDSVGTVEEQESFDGVVGSVQSVPTENSSAEVSMESANIKVQETENAAQDLGGPGIVAHSSAASDGYNLDSVEASSSSCLPVTSMSTTMPSPIVQPIMSTVSSVTSQPEVPVNLQFGLFSGPSLIPSPVPAIQIGSIQMPLHLHHQVGPSLTQMHPSQPPFFQFGQLRYAAPMSQGILPLAPQSVSFVQPTVPAHYSFNQNQETLLHNTAVQDTSTQRHISKDTVSSSLLNQQASVPKLLDLSRKNAPKEVTLLPVRQGSENESLTSQNPAQNSHQCESESRTKLLVENQGHHDIPGKKNYRYIANNKELQGQSQVESSRSQFISKAPGPMSGNKGKRFVYTVKNSGSRPPFPVSEAPNTDFSGYQRRPRQKFRRTEFRVRENVEKRQMESYSGVEDNSNFQGRLSGFSARSGAKKDGSFNRPFKQTVEFEGINSDSSGSRVVDHESKTEKRLGKEAPAKRLTSSLNISRSGEGNPKRNSSSVEDVDAPMQSGIVRVFRQPGIEAASDEDDFIEVRSKRQMLNDRREQREKEIKAKSRVIKASRKPRFVSQNIGVPANSSRTSTSLGGEAPTSITSDTVVIDGRGLTKVEVPAGFTTTAAAATTVVSQPLAPIGTPTVSTDAQAAMRSHSIKSLQTGPVPVVANCATNLGPGLSFDSKNAGLDNVQTSLGSWGSGRINQQVMALTQTQLDDAMKTARFDSHVACLIDHSSAVIERSKPSPSILTQDKSFSSSAGPLNSLLAGEKIQFGAVTSPTILPASSRAPGSCRLDVLVDNSLSAVESNCTLFFEKEQHPDESCVHLDDPEAEAEAAASAVAVAAISSDENVGNGMGAGAVSASDTKSFGGPDIEGLSSGGAVGNQQLASQSRAEESLTVALPADLSVETPSLSLWPPLPSPQNSSSQMLSHFPGAPPSHFPCYEMNPMLGGPIFAFTPHDESSGTDSQSQKSNTSGSGPLGAWQQCHSGVDSFYGPPAGFTGPFISPSGGIPGVQGPPHMVVYNHFTPVGQFGQVGLSFMGTTYIPSGKQPDWKHNPASSTMGIGEGDMNNLNVANAQRNPPNMPAPIQHLAPGSPLLPLASPFAMFDMSPFQSSSDVPVQARWSHVPASHLHSVPLSMPLQQQAEGGLPSQFSHGMPVDQSTGSRFHESCSLAPQDSRRNFPVVSDSTAQFADELGLVDPSSSAGTRVVTSRPASFSSTNGALKGQSVVAKSSSRSNTANTGIQNNSSNSTSSSQSMSSVLKNQSTHHQQNQNQQYLHPTGYTDQRGGGVSHKVGSGSEWPHRRMGFQGRNQSSGTDKNFPSIKTKQIYVAKTATSGTSTPRV